MLRSSLRKLKKPSIDWMFTDIFEVPSEDLKEQMKELRSVLDKYPGEYDLECFEGGKEAL